MATRRTQKSDQAPAAPKYLGVFVTEDYQRNGETHNELHPASAPRSPTRRDAASTSRSPKVSRSAGSSSPSPPRVRARRARPVEPSASMP